MHNISFQGKMAFLNCLSTAWILSLLHRKIINIRLSQRSREML